MRYTIANLADDTSIVPLLERDRRWCAYGLCDLEQAYRPHARYIGAWRAGAVDAAVLVYAPRGLTVLAPFGSAEGVRAILERADDLPSSVFLMARDADLPALRLRYRFGDGDVWAMRRMLVHVDETRPAQAVDAEIRRLTGHDLAALQALYDFELQRDPEMLRRELYFGAFVEGRLVAVAGTHAYSQRHGIGTVGGVFTHPDYRGRGLATATTGAVTRALARRGIRDMALNVRADNAPAIAAYTRLGFVAHDTFWEGNARLVTSD